jgi:hypothetical protein
MLVNKPKDQKKSLQDMLKKPKEEHLPKEIRETFKESKVLSKENYSKYWRTVITTSELVKTSKKNLKIQWHNALS